jgi:hypothetical protein
MKRARWSRPQPLKIIATVRRIANRWLTCVRRVTPCMVNYLTNRGRVPLWRF